MKRILATILTLCIAILTLASCQNSEEYYQDKVICISVTHISGFEAQEEYDVYFESIKKGESYKLPNGNSNPYEVTVSITKIDKEKITLEFSQPMDKNDISGAKELKAFKLGLSESQSFATPTVGGGDVFIFRIIDRKAMNYSGIMPHS